MPYRRKRFHRRRSTASKNLRFIKNKKGARSQQLQMTSLQRQLTATKNKLRDRAQYSQWELPLEPSSLGTSIDLTNGEFYVVGLTRPAAMTGLFQSVTGGGTIPPIPAIASNIATYKSWDIQMLFSPKNSLTALTPRIIRVYVLSLKKKQHKIHLQTQAGWIPQDWTLQQQEYTLTSQLVTEGYRPSLNSIQRLSAYMPTESSH